MRKIVIGVMGPGKGASKNDTQNAFELGKLIAAQDWILLSGGRNEGVMDAVNKGAKSAGGFTIGIIPAADNSLTSEAVDVAVITGMGSARNNINVLSSTIIVACGMGEGTASEVALALKAKKEVVLLTDSQKAKEFFLELNSSRIHIANTPEEAVKICYSIL